MAFCFSFLAVITSYFCQLLFICFLGFILGLHSIYYAFHSNIFILIYIEQDSPYKSRKLYMQSSKTNHGHTKHTKNANNMDNHYTRSGPLARSGTVY